MPLARLLSLAISLSAIASLLAGCDARQVHAAVRDQFGTLAFGGLKRSYIVHLPPGPPVGLVLSLHGGGGTGEGQQGLTDFDAVADASNLLVVYPDGYDKSWADGRGKSPADRRHLDDVGFLVALVTKLRDQFAVPAGRASSPPACPTAVSCPTGWPVIEPMSSPRSRRCPARWV